MGYLPLLLSFLISNAFHSLVALLWLKGIQKLSGPIAPISRANLSTLALILPLAVSIEQFLGPPASSNDFVLVRLPLWIRTLMDKPALLLGVWALFAGTVAVFLIQEVRPLFRAFKRKHISAIQSQQLEQWVDRIIGLYHQAGLKLQRPKVCLIETNDPVAMIFGIVRPVLLISRKLLESCSRQEADVIIAHEIAHLYFGGNLRMLCIWAVRAIQAANPISLILFRDITDLMEMACDDLAATLTGDRKVLAQAIQKMSETNTAVSGTLLKRARQELLQRAEEESTSYRIRVLEHTSHEGALPSHILWLCAVALGGMLWVIV
ncbi:MAG: M48 family metalloprotease [Deltaproteobacteria bacterium]|nr:M48 family metalloprotease [Deltaproteobacteria bacterium]